jgi:proline dehydrogenase
LGRSVNEANQTNVVCIMQSSLSFNNTRIAFSTKSNRELSRQHRLFGLLRRKWVVKLGARLTFMAFQLHLPISGLVKRTIFKQFCAGENLEECYEVVQDLSKSNVDSILDYSVEGKGKDEDFENVKFELIKIIQLAGLTSNIPYTCIKLTALFPTDLLEKSSMGISFSDEERAAWYRGMTRFTSICKEAALNSIPVYVDAEESWIQPAIDRITEEQMWKYNSETAIICNTVQMYRSDRLDYVRQLIAEARNRKMFVGIKLVRGAYMEKEAEHAKQLNIAYPINSSKEATDRCYNKALEYCLQNHDIVSLCIGTHNEESTLLACELMKKLGIDSRNRRIYFSQLYGMSDNITYNLAAHGYNVAKYVPYGPIRSVLPYLVRRAEENTSIAGQMSRELSNLHKELARRNSQKRVSRKEIGAANEKVDSAPL